MNFQNVEKEIKKYSDFFKASQSTVSKFANFYKEIGKIGTKFADRMKKLLDEFYIDLMKEDRSTTYHKLLTNFYNEKNRFITRIKAYFTLLDKTYGDKLFGFDKDHRSKNKENISKLNKINSTLVESKNLEDKWKNQYFDMCKNIVETGKKIKNLEENEKANTNPKENAEMINKLKIQLTKYKELKELKKKNYKEEQIKLNKLLESYETNYNTIKEAISKEYSNRITFIHKILNEINSSTTNFLTEFTESIKKIESFREEINIKRDIKTFRQDFNFYINKDNTKVYKRFILEEFLDYDYVIENSENSDNKKPKNNLNIVINNNENSDQEFDRAKALLHLGESLFLDLDLLNEKGKEINEIIDNLLNNKDKIENDKVLEIINYIENNGENCNNFMELLATHFCQNEFVVIKNQGNFHNLINILIIVLNFCFDKKDFFDTCFFVIFVSEKGLYFSEDEKQINQSILKVISKQMIFNSVNFWKDLINARIDLVAKVDIKKEFEKRRKNINSNPNGFFGKLFKGGKKEENEIIENEILQSQIYKEKSCQYFTKVFYDYLKHFSNFSFSKAEELLDSSIEKCNLDEKTINFFRKVIKSDNACKLRLENNKKIIKRDNSIIFNYRQNKQFKDIKENSIKSILFSLKYIDKAQYPSIITLTKKYHKKISKIFYKNILLSNKNMDIKKHLEIWKILLNYKKIKNEYDYKKIKEENKDPNKKIMCSDIINLDIIRTHFSKNKEEKIEKIGHILKAISSQIPSLNYYQGMNQIAAFLLNICEDNEEEAFYIYMSFLKSTDYTSLFLNDLEMMNTLFYQFDRLLNLYLPEIYIFLKASSINSGYFISPWFITLFTNAFNDFENQNNAKSIMIIWDMFIFSGWKAIMKIGIILLKSKERFTIEKLSECLLPFLTADILKSEILNSEHYDELMNYCTSPEFKIPTSLLKEFEKEYDIKKTIPFFINDNHVNTY